MGTLWLDCGGRETEVSKGLNVGCKLTRGLQDDCRLCLNTLKVRAATTEKPSLLLHPPCALEG